MQNNETELLEKCIQGDNKAFEELIEQYSQRLFNVIYRIVSNKHDADDIYQNVVFKAYKSIKNFKIKSSFFTWIYRIAVNECLDTIKKSNNNNIVYIDKPIETDDSEITTQIMDKSGGPEEKYENKELRGKIIFALESIKEDFKIVIVLRDIQGLSYEEIAEILKCPEGTVKSRLNRARDMLKSKLKNLLEL
jgi:RNA polymerase sigma-70 factor (ECF subfamily)